MSESEKLKPCPFCGCKNLNRASNDDSFYSYWIECGDCEIVVTQDSEEQAIAAWNRRANGWIKTTDRLPEKPGLMDYEHIDCLIIYKGEILKRPWNCEHLCWDQEDYDDFFCAPTEASYWMPLHKPPEEKE